MTDRRPRSARVLPGRLAILLCLTAAGCTGDGIDTDIGTGKGPATCVMRQVAELPVLNRTGLPVVEAAINGTPFGFIVDTGTGISIIGADDAGALYLPISFGNRYVISGIGGPVFASEATVHTDGMVL